MSNVASDGKDYSEDIERGIELELKASRNTPEQWRLWYAICALNCGTAQYDVLKFVNREVAAAQPRLAQAESERDTLQSRCAELEAALVGERGCLRDERQRYDALATRYANLERAARELCDWASQAREHIPGAVECDPATDDYMVAFQLSEAENAVRAALSTQPTAESRSEDE